MPQGYPLLEYSKLGGNPALNDPSKENSYD
jgi:hypothetical protein